MNLTEEYIKNLEVIGFGSFGILYKDGNKVYKIYKKEVKGEFYEITSNPSLKNNISNKYKLNKLMNLSGNVKYGNLVCDKIYIDGVFSGVVFNYILGDTLRSKRDELSFREKIKVSKQIFSGVNELIENNIYPLDLHMGNILIDSNLNVKLIDLDDYLTKVTCISNPMVTKWSYLKLKDTLERLLRYHDNFSISKSNYLYQSNEPNFKANKKGISNFLKYKTMEKQFVFISPNTNISLIKKYDSSTDIILLYDGDLDKLEEILSYFHENEIYIDLVIRPYNIHKFLSNYNVYEYYNLSENSNEHILVKK